MLLSIPKIKLAAALLLACALPVAAQSQELGDGTPIRMDDVARLAQFDAAAGSALLDMMAFASEADRNAVAAALLGQPMPSEDALQELPGTWSCQMMKLGGNLGAVVYQPFKCSAGSDGSFEKLTGSQRTKGAVHRDGDQLVYLGTGFIYDDPQPPAYADLPDPVDPQSLPQRVPEVGILQVINTNRARILFPYPVLESKFNILLLTR
ncbi:DUF4893 domain-containing protein [Paracoccus sp. 11-3]|uniref:DUF4893 domain-containing protein n=1 Tax=Paracoccus amoyensis TaxID=2760093 RepID=A0A926G527_9RHOB|nr:DUF4893 domain-containing protein [Paracoccus amoyensis]MBC9245878.1 DUF4893 domain-containing protein [Paracoccus amoyensis]